MKKYYYKALTKKPDGPLTSMIASGPCELAYTIGEKTYPATPTSPIFIFNTQKMAQKFAVAGFRSIVARVVVEEEPQLVYHVYDMSPVFARDIYDAICREWRKQVVEIKGKSMGVCIPPPLLPSATGGYIGTADAPDGTLVTFGPITPTKIVWENPYK